MNELTYLLLRGLILHGPEAIIKMIRALQSDNPTPEEIRENMVDMPEVWFESE